MSTRDYQSIQEFVEAKDLSSASELAAILEQEYADKELSDIELSSDDYDESMGEFEEREEELSEYWDGDDFDIDYDEYDTGDGEYAEA